MRSRAFTIIEMLVATAVFMMMVVLLVSVVSQVNSVWQQTDGQKVRRESGRALLDLMGRDFQAAIGPADAKNASRLSFDLNPTGFAENFRSAIFWMCSNPGSRQANDITTVGYFVRRVGNSSVLCRVQQPGAQVSFWSGAAGLAPAVAPDFKGLAADGVLGLYVTLFDKKGDILANPKDNYSSALLPFSVEVALIIADSRTTQRLIESQTIPGAQDSVDAFMAAIPDRFKSGVQVYRTRFDLPSAR